MEFAQFDPAKIINEYEQQSVSYNLPLHHPLNEPQKNENPGHIKHLCVHESIVIRLNEFIAKNKIPHLIFHGPSGSGKHTLVREFIHRIYGGDKIKMKTHVMTVNCSHGKGIQFIREELKFFAKSNAQTKSNLDGGKPSEFKIIILLNAHHLTVDAQSALRRCIELFSYNTRFFIVVENKDKLLNPILSRFCDIFVPEPALDGATVNLHKYVLSQQFKNMDDASVQEDDVSMFESLFAELDGRNLVILFEKINSLYESGKSCLDLMDWVRTKTNRWTEQEYSLAVARFYQIKPQFRCEKLLMLFMVNFLYRKNV
jgi:replication-associated recombination protein RarA